MAVYNVTTSAGLYAALAKAQGGDTINLAPGNYGKLGLNDVKGVSPVFASNVTIRSADPDQPAVFTGVGLGGATNLTLDGLKFDYTFQAGDLINERPFRFEGCTNLVVRNCDFDGDVARGISASSDGYGYATALFVRGGSNITFADNEFENFHRAAVITRTSNVTFSGNDVHSIRSDGLNVSQVAGIRILDNHFHDFRASPTSGDHRDMIQFWTAGTTAPSRDILIEGNRLDIGNGDYTQSIFMGNEAVSGGAGLSMYYKNVTVRDNVIVNGHAHGITVSAADGVVVDNNSVLHADGRLVDGRDSGVEIPRINISGNSRNVTITDNIVAQIDNFTGQAGWRVVNNLLVQDQDTTRPNHYSQHFVNSTLGEAVDGVHSYLAIRGGLIEKMGVGASDTRAGTTGLDAAFSVVDVNAATRVFDARHSTLDGQPLPDGAVVTWTFGDGTSTRGLVVEHQFADGGRHPVTLTVTLPDGRRAAESCAVTVQSGEVLDITSAGRIVAYHDDAPIQLGVVPKLSAEGMQLGAYGTTLKISRDHVSDVIKSNEFTAAFTLDCDRVGSAGEVFRIHGSMIAVVTSTGEMRMTVTETDGSIRTVTTVGAGLNRTTNVDRDIVVDLADGRLEIWVDGRLRGAGAVDDVGGRGYDLVFGNPWGKGNFVGDLQEFHLSVGTDHFAVSPQTRVLAADTGSTATLDTYLQTLDPDDRYAQAMLDL